MLYCFLVQPCLLAFKDKGNIKEKLWCLHNYVIINLFSYIQKTLCVCAHLLKSNRLVGLEKKPLYIFFLLIRST